MPKRFQVIPGGRAATRRIDDPVTEAWPDFEEALLIHLDRLYAFALRLVSGHKARAEDLVQETCLKACRHYRELRDPERFKQWLFQVLVNTHLNEFSRAFRRSNVVDVDLSEALLEPGFHEQVRTPEEDLFDQLLDVELQAALDRLPFEFRLVVWLSDVEGLSYREIAEVVNCPLGTVASRLYRGHSLLRERLQEYAQRRGLIRE
ncbi:MAG: sigma-70 family RNA polymerase sigma factor [Acidobacteria bacterium]|nr:sigma-70 family RNA polymerase sigma factor [Acidobacteriota bacterium]